MKFISYFFALNMSILIGLSTQANAAAIQKSIKPVQSSMISEKQSPIVKALSQQKRDRSENKLDTDLDQLRMLNSINTAPTQNFLAEQHQRFSRFVQALFQQHNS